MIFHENNSNAESYKQRLLASLPITFVCIHGNHEKRPTAINSYEYVFRFGTKMLYEKSFPNILFALDGETYLVQGKSFLVIGGACSPNKYLPMGNNTVYDDEQPSIESFEKIRQHYHKKKNVDYIMTHTCPYDYIPYDACTLPINQSIVDRTTEKRLQYVYDNIDFKHWYCGHYHTNRSVAKITFLYKQVLNL